MYQFYDRFLRLSARPLQGLAVFSFFLEKMLHMSHGDTLQILMVEFWEDCKCATEGHEKGSILWWVNKDGGYVLSELINMISDKNVGQRFCSIHGSCWSVHFSHGQFFLKWSMMHSTISCLNPFLLIRDGHVTPVVVRERRRATKDSVYFAQQGGKNQGAWKRKQSWRGKTKDSWRKAEPNKSAIDNHHPKMWKGWEGRKFRPSCVNLQKALSWFRNNF